MVKHSSDDVKKLAAFPAGGPGQGARKPIQTKLSKEFAAALQAFQRVQRSSAERQRTYVESQKRQVDRLVEEAE